MAQITVSVSNTNTVTLENIGSTYTIDYTVARATCKGNTITYVNVDTQDDVLPTGTLAIGAEVSSDFIDDGLYRLTTVENSVTEVYYFRVTGKIEACERNLLQDIFCNTEKCDRFEYNQKLEKVMTFLMFKNRLYNKLNQYQQEQSISSLLSLPEVERLTICQDFCILKDICGCTELTTYNTTVTDCGCSK